MNTTNSQLGDGTNPRRSFICPNASLIKPSVLSTGLLFVDNDLTSNGLDILKS
jgi:hypothetical protein